MTGVEHYYWDDLHHQNMDDSLIEGARRKTKKNDIDIFISNALAMKRLAGVSRANDSNRRLKQVSYEIAEAYGRDLKSVTLDLVRLLERHRQEWTSFVEELPRESWFRRLCFL